MNILFHINRSARNFTSHLSTLAVQITRKCSNRSLSTIDPTIVAIADVVLFGFGTAVVSFGVATITFELLEKTKQKSTRERVKDLESEVKELKKEIKELKVDREKLERRTAGSEKDLESFRRSIVQDLKLALLQIEKQRVKERD